VQAGIFLHTPSELDEIPASAGMTILGYFIARAITKDGIFGGSYRQLHCRIVMNGVTHGSQSDPLFCFIATEGVPEFVGLAIAYR